jgi:small-conductance mechanosensitive channel
MSFWDQFVEGLSEIGRGIADFTPRLFGALLILLVGWWVAKLVRNIIQKLLDRPTVTKVVDRSGVGPALRNAGYSGASILANVIYAILLLAVFLLAAQALRVPELVALLSGLIAYLPLVVVAIVILVIAAAVGNFLGDLVQPWATSRNAPWVALVARYSVIIFGALTSLEVLGVGRVSTRIFEFTFGAFAVAFAIAFGVGGIETARKWWGKYLTPGN